MWRQIHCSLVLTIPLPSLQILKRQSYIFNYMNFSKESQNSSTKKDCNDLSQFKSFTNFVNGVHCERAVNCPGQSPKSWLYLIFSCWNSIYKLRNYVPYQWLVIKFHFLNKEDPYFFFVCKHGFCFHSFISTDNFHFLLLTKWARKTNYWSLLGYDCVSESSEA